MHIPNHHQARRIRPTMPSLTPSKCDQSDARTFAAHHRSARNGEEARPEEAPAAEASQPPDPGSADDDFFSRFERAPQTALGRSNPLVLEPEQLESMHDARTSPMPTSPSASRQDSYFGAAAQPKPITGSSEPKKEAASSSLSPASPSSWTGSLRKTWTTLRGIQSEIASHLPSASDFIVPADEVEGESAHAGAVDSNPGGGLLFATDAPDQSDIELGRRHSGSSGGGGLPHASDYSQGTPFAPHASTSAFSSGAASLASKHGGAASLRARDLFASPSTGSLGVDSLSSSGTLRRGPVHAATAPISARPASTRDRRRSGTRVTGRSTSAGIGAPRD